jgi:hypothetical protein
MYWNPYNIYFTQWTTGLSSQLIMHLLSALLHDMSSGETEPTYQELADAADLRPAMLIMHTYEAE